MYIYIYIYYIYDTHIYMQLYLIWVCPKIGYSPPWVSGFGIRQISNLQTNPRGDILVDVGNILVLMISRIKLNLFTVNMAHLSRAGRFSRAASCTIATCQEVSLWNTSASCSGMRRFSQSFACWHSQFLWGRKDRLVFGTLSWFMLMISIAAFIPRGE